MAGKGSNKSAMCLNKNWNKLLNDNPELKVKKKRQSSDTTVLSTKKKTNVKPSKTSPASSHVWFDNVDKIYLESEQIRASDTTTTHNPLVKDKSFDGLTKVVAIDCEMVGTGDGGKDSILARVSIVNQFGKCIYDKYVQRTEEVTDYRTSVSGIRPHDMDKGEQFKVVQKEVSDILKKRILVGHAIQHDLKVLFLGHPRHNIRDTSKYKLFRRLFNGRTPSLKNLTERLLGVRVQEGEHNSIQDAQAAMRLYTMHRRQWEADIQSKKHVSVRQEKNLAKKTA